MLWVNTRWVRLLWSPMPVRTNGSVRECRVLGMPGGYQTCYICLELSLAVLVKPPAHLALVNCATSSTIAACQQLRRRVVSAFPVAGTELRF
jgi:hypothetical protein